MARGFGEGGKVLSNYAWRGSKSDTVKMNLKGKEQMKVADRVEEATNITRRCLWTLEKDRSDRGEARR